MDNQYGIVDKGLSCKVWQPEFDLKERTDSHNVLWRWQTHWHSDAHTHRIQTREGTRREDGERVKGDGGKERGREREEEHTLLLMLCLFPCFSDTRLADPNCLPSESICRKTLLPLCNLQKIDLPNEESKLIQQHHSTASNPPFPSDFQIILSPLPTFLSLSTITVSWRLCRLWCWWGLESFPI